MDWFDLLAVQGTLKRCTKFTLKWFDGVGLVVGLFFFLLHYEAYRILVSRPGMEPAPHVVEVWSLNHWITREVPRWSYFSTIVTLDHLHLMFFGLGSPWQV